MRIHRKVAITQIWLHVDFGEITMPLVKSRQALSDDREPMIALLTALGLVTEGIGKLLVDRLVEVAAALGIECLYCFSTDAQSYWQKRGFVYVPVQELVDRLPTAPQVIHFDRLAWLPTEVALRKDLNTGEN